MLTPREKSLEVDGTSDAALSRTVSPTQYQGAILFLSVLYACVFYFCICTCSAQLSMFHMEKRSRNTLIIIIIPAPYLPVHSL